VRMIGVKVYNTPGVFWVLNKYHSFPIPGVVQQKQSLSKQEKWLGTRGPETRVPTINQTPLSKCGHRRSRKQASLNHKFNPPWGPEAAPGLSLQTM